MPKLKYFLLSPVISVTLLGLTFAPGINAEGVSLFILFLCIFGISLRLANNMAKKEISLLDDKLQSQRYTSDELLDRLEGARREKNYLERKLAGLSALYSVTKEMSFSIRFNELTHSLDNFLKDNFEFSKFIIALFKYDNARPRLDESYEIKEESEKIELDKPLADLIESVPKSKGPLLLEKDLPGEFAGFAKRNILLAPLISRRRTIAVFLIADIKKEDYDNFLILASQVALQLERIKLFDDVERLSITDGLTGVYLRRHFLERLRQEIIRAEQYRTNMAFVMLDLDHFKQCNDTFGHLVGDAALQGIAGAVKKNVREIDLVGRYGGEEFCMLLPETNKVQAVAVAERIRKAIELQTIKAYDETVRMTVSMGISCFPEDGKTAGELIEKADRALYKAKAEGRNRISKA